MSTSCAMGTPRSGVARYQSPASTVSALEAGTGMSRRIRSADAATASVQGTMLRAVCLTWHGVGVRRVGIGHGHASSCIARQRHHGVLCSQAEQGTHAHTLQLRPTQLHDVPDCCCGTVGSSPSNLNVCQCLCRPCWGSLLGLLPVQLHHAAAAPAESACSPQGRSGCHTIPATFLRPAHLLPSDPAVPLGASRLWGACSAHGTAHSTGVGALVAQAGSRLRVCWDASGSHQAYLVLRLLLTRIICDGVTCPGGQPGAGWARPPKPTGTTPAVRSSAPYSCRSKARQGQGLVVQPLMVQHPGLLDGLRPPLTCAHRKPNTHPPPPPLCRNSHQQPWQGQCRPPQTLSSWLPPLRCLCIQPTPHTDASAAHCPVRGYWRRKRGGRPAAARLLTCEGGINPYPGAYTGRGCAIGLPTGPGRPPPGFVICLSSAKPLNVPLTMSVTIDTARLRLWGVPLMVTFVGSTVWSICNREGPHRLSPNLMAPGVGSWAPCSGAPALLRPLDRRPQHIHSLLFPLAWMRAPV